MKLPAEKSGFQRVAKLLGRVKCHGFIEVLLTRLRQQSVTSGSVVKEIEIPFWCLRPDILVQATQVEGLASEEV